MANWQPNEQLVHQMMTLLNDIHVPDTNRQLQIHQEFLHLQTRTDFALYLMYLTSNCPGMDQSRFQLSEGGRIAACSRLARVFRDVDPTARQGLDFESSSYIRDECIKYVPVQNTLIRSCVIDVLTYLCTSQRFKGWENIFSQLCIWISPNQPQHNNEQYILQEAGFQMLYALMSKITNDDDLTLIFFDKRWKGLWDQMISHIITNLLSNNTNVRQLSVQILNDISPSKPSSLFENSEIFSLLMKNLYVLSINDQQNPKTNQYIMSLLSTLSTLSINHVIGFDLTTVSISDIQIHSHNNPIPIQTATIGSNGIGQQQQQQQLQNNQNQQQPPSFQDNMFGMVDNFLLLATSFLTTQHHTKCNDDFDRCNNIYDLLALESVHFLLSLVSTSSFEKPSMIAFRTALLGRHINNIVPRLFQCCKFTGCDLRMIETQHKIAMRANQVSPQQHTAQNGGFGGSSSPNQQHGNQYNNNNSNAINQGNSFDDADEGNNGDIEDGGGDDDDEEEDGSNTNTVLRRTSTIALSHCIATFPEQSLAVFFSYVDTALSSSNIADQESALLFVGLFGAQCGDKFLERLQALIPQLLTVLGASDQHIAISTMTPWTIGKLREIFIKCDANGMRSAEGLSVIQILFSQSIVALRQSYNPGQVYAILHSLEAFLEYQQVYVYALQFAHQLFELTVEKITTSANRQIVIEFAGFFSTLLTTFSDEFQSSSSPSSVSLPSQPSSQLDQTGTISTDFLIHKISTPFISHVLGVQSYDETLADLLLALHSLLYELPLQFIQIASSPIFLRLLELFREFNAVYIESIDAETKALQSGGGNGGDYIDDSGVSWHIINSTASTMDCISTLLERMGAGFGLLFTQPLPQSLQNYPNLLQSSGQRIVLTLQPQLALASPQEQSHALEQILQHGSVLLLIDFLNTALLYKDTTLRQGAFGILGELCKNFPAHQLLTPFYYVTIQYLAGCMTADPDDINIMAQAGWYLSILVESHGEAIWDFISPPVSSSSATQNPNQQKKNPPNAKDAVRKCLYIAVTDAKTVRQPQNTAMVNLAPLASKAPIRVLNLVLESCDNQITQANNILTKLFECVVLVQNQESKWDIFKSFSFLLPLIITNNDFCTVILSALQVISTMIVKVIKGLEQHHKWQPSDEILSVIKTKFSESYWANQTIWQQAWGQITKEQQDHITKMLKM